MTREEKCLLAIERGYIYNPETGEIFNKFGKLVNGKINGYIHFCIHINKKTLNIYGHQFAWYYVYKECVKYIDHINRIKYDNRICNLRSVTSQQNSFNRNCKGYSYKKYRNKYEAQIAINNKTIFLGHYKTEEEAKNAYLQAKEKYHIM
jgi:hypothetical protein